MQHQDGSSHLLFASVPNCVAYDPCFGYELAAILQDGILRGLYRLRPASTPKSEPRVQLLGAGILLREALAAGELLARDWGVAADVWSVTSFTELRRDGLAVERRNRVRPAAEPLRSWIEQCLTPTAGPIVAVSDYLRAVPDLIRAWVPRRYVTLGADGFGRSDTRAALRRFFEVDRRHIALAALRALADEGTLDRGPVAQALAQYGIDPDSPNPWDC